MRKSLHRLWVAMLAMVLSMLMIVPTQSEALGIEKPGVLRSEQPSASNLSAIDYFEAVGAADAYAVLTDPEVTQYFASIDILGEDSALSIDNMIASMEYIQEANHIRNSLGLTEYLVGDTLMAIALANTEHAVYNIEHSMQFADVAENLAWGYGEPSGPSSPFRGWYDDEKAIYDRAIADGEYPGLDSMSISEILSTYPELLPAIGHYKILLEPYPVTGFGYSLKRGAYVSTFAQIFGSNGSARSANNGSVLHQGRVMSVEDYLADLVAFRDGGAVIKVPTISAGSITIGGEAKAGLQVTAELDGWSPANVSLSYQWYRDSFPIPLATGESYTVTQQDVGRKLTVTITASVIGAASKSVTSKAVIPTAGITRGSVSIAGEAKVGETVFAQIAGWEPLADLSFSYQWVRDGKAIPGATSSTYQVTKYDLGTEIAVYATGRYLDVAPQTVTSDVMLIPVVIQPGIVRVQGAAVVDGQLQAETSGWEPNHVQFSYQWLRGDVAISGATDRTYTVVAADEGEWLTVRVTGTLDGVTNVSEVSNLVMIETPLTEVSVSRLAGGNRFVTSAEISGENFDSGGDVVFIANGMDFPDALSGAPAAAEMGAPVLLTESNGLPQEVKAELARLKPKKIVVLGGTGVVSPAVLTSLRSYSSGSVERWSGDNRFATSAAISKKAFAGTGGVVYIANGNDFPDALSGAPVAGVNSGPVLLVESGSIPTDVRSELQRLKPEKIVVLGGTGVISPEVQTSLRKYTVSQISGSVERWSGDNRFATSAAISRNAFTGTGGVVYIANGMGFPDALSGAPVAGVNRGPVLLVETNRVPYEIQLELKRLKPQKIVVLGGDGVVSPWIESALKYSAS